VQTAPLILNLSTRKWVVSFMLRSLYPWRKGLC